MATDTATIRVPRRTRDLLANRAKAQGMSLAAFLSEIARQRQLDEIYASERAARRADAENPAAMAEQREWEATLEDGIDW